MVSPVSDTQRAQIVQTLDDCIAIGKVISVAMGVFAVLSLVFLPGVAGLSNLIKWGAIGYLVYELTIVAAEVRNTFQDSLKSSIADFFSSFGSNISVVQWHVRDAPLLSKIVHLLAC